MVGILESTISLSIEMVALCLLTSGYLLKRQKKYRHHALSMLSALALHIVAILLVMVPSLAAFFSVPSSVNFADILVIATLVHVFAGLLAAMLGVWLVGSWHLQESLQSCFRKKRVMDVTLSLWLLAIALGLVLYLVIIQVI
jgi:uncharacterized membrane protein YozB (DUF420 family)